MLNLNVIFSWSGSGLRDMSARRRRASTPVHTDNPLPFFEVVRATQASDDEPVYPHSEGQSDFSFCLRRVCVAVRSRVRSSRLREV
jgi:hypothetical protein